MFPQRSARTFLEPEVLSRLASVPLLARKPMQGNVSGRHASPHRGASIEFAEYRDYVPGDDLRCLDWRAYGRSDRFCAAVLCSTPAAPWDLVLAENRSLPMRGGSPLRLAILPSSREMPWGSQVLPSVFRPIFPRVGIRRT